MPPRGLLDYDHSWQYNQKIREILFKKPIPQFPSAFALVKTGRGMPEYCVWLVQLEGGGYTIIARQATHHIWYSEEGTEIRFREGRASLNHDHGDDIAQFWLDVLSDIRVQPDDQALLLRDGGGCYFACHIQGRGVLAGELPNDPHTKGKLAEMGSLTHWMAELALGAMIRR